MAFRRDRDLSSSRVSEARGPAMTRERLSTLSRRRLHDGRNLTKAVVDLIEIDARAVVLKDVAMRPWPVRRILGPWQLDREDRAYRALSGVPGTPAFVARVDRQAIAIEYVAGESLAAFRPGELTMEFFDRLNRLLQAIHARGVAHGDLHRHDVLVAGGGEPYLIDFSTSVILSPRAGSWSRFLFRQMCSADHRSAAKLRRRFLPDSGTEVPARPGLYRLGSWARRLRNLLRRARPGASG